MNPQLSKLHLPDRPTVSSSSLLTNPNDLSPRSIDNLSPSLHSPSSPWALTSSTLDSVVKLYVTHCEPKYIRPWQMTCQNYTTSSGFILSNRLILTNAHSIEHHTLVRVKRRSSDVRYVASVLAIGEECDLALLTVKDDTFWDDLTPLKISDSLPLLRDNVIVAGYPHGGDGMSVTAGVVSRIELLDYTSASTLLSIQIDAAINPGNSGGPAFSSNGSIVGVAFRVMSSDHSENIGYVIPSNVVQHFLQDYHKNGKYTGFCGMGFEWNHLESSAMRSYYNLPENESGILITDIEFDVKELNKFDIVTHIDGHDVSNSGMLYYQPCDERLSFLSVVADKFIGDNLSLRIYRNGKLLNDEIKYKLNDINHHKLIPMHLELNTTKNIYIQPDYFVFGGFVFVKLSDAYLKSTYGSGVLGNSRIPIHLKWLWEFGRKNNTEKEVVLLSHVLNCNFNIHYEHIFDERVLSCNGIQVESLLGLYDIVKDQVINEKVQFVKLELMRDIIVVDKKEAVDAHKDILKMHHIAKDSSFSSVSLDQLERIEQNEIENESDCSL